MIEFQDQDGLVFWPKHEVASLTPEFRNRWRAVMRDGSVAHRPTPPPDGPWVRLGISLVMPCWLTRAQDGWKDPAGFNLGEGVLPAVPLPVPDPALLPEIGCRADQVFALTAGPRFGCTWCTDLGTVVWPGVSAAKAARHHPRLVCVRRGHHVNRQRLRKITTCDPLITVTLDNGTVVTTTGPGFAKEMGLASLDHLEPICWEMYAWHQLRDWPFPLLQASGELLRACFPTSRRLIANLIWQQLRYRQLGVPQHGAESHSDFFYLIKPALHRAGFLQRTTGSVPEDPTDAEGLKLTCYKIMEKLYEARLLTYAELGFVDKPGDTRSLGSRLPGSSSSSKSSVANATPASSPASSEPASSSSAAAPLSSPPSSSLLPSGRSGAVRSSSSPTSTTTPKAGPSATPPPTRSPSTACRASESSSSSAATASPLRRKNSTPAPAPTPPPPRKPKPPTGSKKAAASMAVR